MERKVNFALERKVNFPLAHPFTQKPALTPPTLRQAQGTALDPELIEGYRTPPALLKERGS